MMPYAGWVYPATRRFWNPAAVSATSWVRAGEGQRFIGVETRFHLRPHRQGASIRKHDIRIENFRDTKLPEGRIDAVIGNVPFADVKLDYHGQKLLPARLTSSPSRSMP